MGSSTMEKDELRQLQHKATTLRAEGKYQETIEACFTLLNVGKELHDHKSTLTAYMNLAASFYSIGDMDEAFNHIEAYEEICLEYGDDIDFLMLYNVLFLIYEHIKEYEKAKGTLKKSIELGEKLEKYNIVSNGYSNYSHICIEQMNYAEALEMAELGLKAAKKQQPESLILELRVKLNMAQALIGLEEFIRSDELIDEIMDSQSLDSFVREKIQCLMLQGSWYSKQGQVEEAFQSLTIAKGLVGQDLYLLKTIQEERIKLCELMKDVSVGYIVQKEYIALLNDIHQKETALKAQKLDMKHSISELEKKVHTDFLTGIYNRSYLESTTNKWLMNASEGNHEVVCLVFDIDNFKRINDEHGHLFGDEIIKLVSGACLELIGENERMGRYGGDEFVMVLNESSLESGRMRAEQIVMTLRNLGSEKDGKMITITSSIGVATNQKGALTSFDDLFLQADLALYQAKKKGKDQFFVFDENLVR